MVYDPDNKVYIIPDLIVYDPDPMVCDPGPVPPIIPDAVSVIPIP